MKRPPKHENTSHRCSRCRVRQLQVPLVARPRNQLYDPEVADIWRPLAVFAPAKRSRTTTRSTRLTQTRVRRRSGRVQHSCKVALQRDLQLVAVRFEQDRLDQRTNGVQGPASVDS